VDICSKKIFSNRMNMVSNFIYFVACLIFQLNYISCSDDASTLNITMPSIQPQHNDDYFCTAIKLDPDNRVYIKQFIPHGDKNYAHHMLLYACEDPGISEEVWKCGEMFDGLDAAPPCKTGSRIIYAWAMNAKPLELADDISFEVGGDTAVKYLVLNVHYKDVSIFNGENAERDSSGFTLVTSKTRTPKLAGIYLLGSGGVIKANSLASQESICQMNEKTVMHPFAFRVHTHSHGVKVSGYKIHDNTWTSIGEMSPQKEQQFYDVSNPDDVIISQHDYLAARCEFKNDEDRDISTGPTQNDEMCNFYVMYYVDSDNELVEDSVCFNNFEWEDFFQNDDLKVPDLLSDSMEQFDEELKPNLRQMFVDLLEDSLMEEKQMDSSDEENRRPMSYMKKNDNVYEYFRDIERRNDYY